MATVNISCNFFRPGDPGSTVTEEDIIHQEGADCPSPDFTSIDEVESEFLEVITERLIPTKLKEKYPNFKQFIWDILTHDRKFGIYKNIHTFPNLMNVKTTKKELLPKFVLQYLAQLPTKFLPPSACEFREVMESFQNFLPGTTSSLQQLLALLGIYIERPIHFIGHKVLRILTENVRTKLTPTRSGGWSVADGFSVEALEDVRELMPNDDWFNYYTTEQHTPNDPIWFLDGNSFLDTEFIVNDIGEQILMDTDKFAMPIDTLLKKSIEIPAHLPIQFWADLLQDYGYFGDSFIFAKFMMTLIGQIENSTDSVCVIPPRKIEINPEFMYPWKFNRLPKEWIPGGFWDYEQRRWIQHNKTDLFDEPTILSESRLPREDSEFHASNDTKDLPLTDQQLFKWDRNDLNSWQLSSDAIGTFWRDVTNPHLVYLVRTKDDYGDEETLINDVIELVIRNITIFHWTLTNLACKVRIDLQNMDYSNELNLLDTDFWNNQLQQPMLSWNDYLDLIKTDGIGDQLLDGTWEIIEHFGFRITRQILIKKALELGYDLNGPIVPPNYDWSTIISILNHKVTPPPFGPQFVHLDPSIYYGIDRYRRLPLEEEYGFTQFLINKSINTQRDNNCLIINEQNGMYLEVDLDIN